MTLPAAALGALLASFGIQLLVLLDKDTLPHLNAIAVDGRVLAFACALAVLIAVALGLLPGLRLGKQSLEAGLREAGRGQSAAGASRRLRSALVVAQIGLTLVLLTGASLLGRSFLKLMRIDPGFTPESAVAMTLSLPSTITPQEDERLRQFYVQLLERAGQLPGVTAVGGINVLPLADRGANGTFLINNDPAQRGYAEYRIASAGYFTAMKIPLLRGRLFAGEDTVSSPHAAVISQPLAQSTGRTEMRSANRFTWQYGHGQRLLNVVGIVGDVRDAELEREPQPTVYAFVATPAMVAGITAFNRRARAVRSAKIDSACVRHQGLRSMCRSASARGRGPPLRLMRRFSLVLFAVFSTVALLIAALGIYGVLWYEVTQRTQEIGIRMALGAQAAHVVRLVIGEGLRLILVGIAAGLAAAFLLTRLMTKLLFGISAGDPLTFVGVALLLMIVGLFACYRPARRATKVDPITTLRRE